MKNQKIYIKKEKAETSIQYHLDAIEANKIKIAKLQEMIDKHNVQIDSLKLEMQRTEEKDKRVETRRRHSLMKMEQKAEKLRAKLEN